MRHAGDGGHVFWAFRGRLGLAWKMEEGGIGFSAMSMGRWVGTMVGRQRQSGSGDR
jgi:hypothetical protein